MRNKSALTGIILLAALLLMPQYTLGQSVSYQHYDSTTNPGAALEKTQAISYDGVKERILIATGFWAYTSNSYDYSAYGSGIFILDLKSNTFQNYNKTNTNLPTNNYLSICWGDTRIIAGSYNRGITVMNELTGEITLFDKNSTPALKANLYKPDWTAPISAVTYENGEIYFAYGEFTDRGICGGVIDLATKSLMHFTYLFSTDPNFPSAYRSPTALFINANEIFFADRYITRFNKLTGAKYNG